MRSTVVQWLICRTNVRRENTLHAAANIIYKIQIARKQLRARVRYAKRYTDIFRYVTVSRLIFF